MDKDTSNIASTNRPPLHSKANKIMLFFCLAFLLVSTCLLVLFCYINSDKENSSSKTVSTAEHQTETTKEDYSKFDTDAVKFFKLYIIDWKKILKNDVESLDSLIIDDNLYFSITVLDNSKPSYTVFHNGSIAQSGSDNEAVRLSGFYNNVLKHKKITGLKVIIHPSHDSNKLFYITGQNRKYIIPVLAEGKDEQVGLKSFKEYSVDEVLKNIVAYVKNNYGFID